MNSRAAVQPPPAAPPRLPDPTNTLIVACGEEHAWNGSFDYEELCHVVNDATDCGFRDLALELPRDWQPLVNEFLRDAEADVRKWRRTQGPDATSEDAWANVGIRKSLKKSWDATWEKLRENGCYVPSDVATEVESGKILGMVACVNGLHPEARMRVHCVDLPSEECRKAIREGDLFLGVALPQSCQREIDGYLAHGETLARQGKRLSSQAEKKFGEAILAKLQAANREFGRSPEQRAAFWAQMKTLCEGPPGMDWRGLNSLARAWALHPEEKPQVRTLPLDDRTYWQEVRKPMPELLPTSEVTARFVDGRTERMAARMAEIAQSVLREEPVCQMIAWAGKLHVDPNLRRASPYDPQTLRRTLGSELAGRADTPAYVCGQKGETLYDLIWRKGEEFQRRAEERERGRSQPERKMPPRESSAGDRKLPPVRVCAQTVQDFAARFRGVAEAMEAARGRATTPEEWAEARSRKPRQGLTPGQRLFLVTARQRNAWEHPPDLARQPIGVLRGAANAEVAAAAARLQEVPGRPAVSRGLVLAKADPERKERQAQALGRLSGVSRDGVDAREGGRREDPIWREAILSRIPELKHPAELSSEKLTPIDYSKTNWRVDRCRQAAREGR